MSNVNRSVVIHYIARAMDDIFRYSEYGDIEREAYEKLREARALINRSTTERWQ